MPPQGQLLGSATITPTSIDLTTGMGAAGSPCTYTVVADLTKIAEN